MSNILALDTSAQACSVALWLDGEVREDHREVPRQHTQLILPMVQQIMAQADINLQQLDGIAFGRGPGSFTGLRICTGVTQGLAFGAKLPVAPVSTLAALALQALEQQPAQAILAMIDARMDEVYWGWFQIVDGVPQLIGEERVSTPEQVQVPAEVDVTCLGIGTGWRLLERIPAAVQSRINWRDADAEPRAGAIARLGAMQLEAGQGVLPEQALPVYLRDNVAKKKADQKKGGS